MKTVRRATESTRRYRLHSMRPINPTDEDVAFWKDVFETHRKAMGTSQKPKSDKQIIKWLKNPHSDSAEYKLWGNGVYVNIVEFVLAGIVWANENTVQTDSE